MPSQRGALSNIRRIAYAPETGGVRGTAGTFVDPSGYQDLSAVCDQAVLADNRQTNSRKTSFASFNGAKSAEVSFAFMQNEDTDTSYGQIFEAALGSKRSSSTLVINSGGTNSATVGAITSGTPDQIVKIEYTTGAPDFLPVKDFSASVITWAIQTLKGARTVSAYKNANQCSGSTYYQNPAADYLSFVAEMDQGAENNQLFWTLQGLVPSSLTLAHDIDGRTSWSCKLTGVDWTNEVSVSQPSDAAEFNDEFLGWAWDVFIQDLTSPAAPTKQPMISFSGVELAPEWIPNKYSAGLTASGTIPGSNINGWKQKSHGTTPFEIVLDTPASAWITARQNKTKYQVYMVGYNGAPGDTPTKTVCIWFPEVVLDAMPQEVDNGGITGMKLVFKIQESVSINAAHKSQMIVSFFNA